MTPKKVALITGASSGIGKELARIHAEHGGDLVLVARNIEKLEQLRIELQSKYGVNVTCIAKDLTIAGSAKEIYDEINALQIKVDYLMNNAGFGLQGAFHKLSWDRQMQMINLNIIALTELTYLFLPDFVKLNSGKILNTSSTASLMPGPLQAVYYATKAYVTFLGNAIAEELYDTKVTVTNLLPGATESEFWEVSGMHNTSLFKDNKLATARSVALDGYEAMLLGKLDVISGLTCTQKMMMATVPFVPKKMLLQNVRKMQEIKG